MAKLTLEIDYEYDFHLIGIACHVPDYRLAWAVNKALGIELTKEKDLDLKVDKKNLGYFSFYRFDQEELERTYHLIGNRSSVGYFIPEQKQMDYFLQYWGNASEQKFKRWQKAIREIPFVLTAIEIDPATLKSAPNLLF